MSFMAYLHYATLEKYYQQAFLILLRFFTRFSTIHIKNYFSKK